jgi:hypothetical protein
MFFRVFQGIMSGPIPRNMKANGMKTRFQGKAFIIGTMVGNMMAIG